MEIECPKCEELFPIRSEDLPERACDSTDYECPYCQHEFTVGWYAEAEVRETRL